MSKKESNILKIQLIVLTSILITVGIFTSIQIIFKESFIGPSSQLVTLFSWFFGLTLGSMIPGFIYKGGEGYNLVFGRFTTKEKAFLWFLGELLLSFVVLAIIGWIVNLIFIRYYMYTHLFIIEWILLVYIWFSNKSKYKFPWLYTILTNLILIGGGFIIFKFY